MIAKAMVLVEPGRLEFKEFDVIPPERDQILLKISVTSVCASDPKILLGQTPFSIFPLVMGHELVGQVAEIGHEASHRYDLKPGDRITIEPSIPCGHCEWCQTEYNYHKCRPLKAYGITLAANQPPFLLGGYAEYMYLLPGSLVYRVAERVPDNAACLSSVIGNGVRWVKHLGKMSSGQRLMISGVGSQGLATLIAAKEFGVGPVVVLGLNQDMARFELAREYGADHIINIDRVDPFEAVPDLLGEPPDVVVETSGVPSAIQVALDLVKMTGKVVSIGLSGGNETAIKFDTLVAKGVTIVCDHGQAGNVQDAMRIINSGKYDIGKINNFHYGLKELPKALDETVHPPDGFIKGAVVFD
jgi:threonine dehydrogenase-like Zn-dependent dehydrogenase